MREKAVATRHQIGALVAAGEKMNSEAFWSCVEWRRPEHVCKLRRKE